MIPLVKDLDHSPGAAPVAWNLNFLLPVVLLAVLLSALGLTTLHLTLPDLKRATFNFTAVRALFQTLVIEGSLTLAIFFALRQRHFGLWQLGLTDWKNKYLRIGLRTYLLILPILAGIGLMAGLFNKNFIPDQELYHILMGLTSLPISLVFLVVVGLVAPFFEEVIFRGFLFGTLRSSFGFRRSMIYSSLIFAALHQSAVAFLPIFFLALMLAYLYERTGSLWPSVVLHMTNNTIATALTIAARRLTA